MLLNDHSDFLLCFSGTQVPGRRKFSNSNVIKVKNKTDKMFVVVYRERIWVKLNLLLKQLGFLRREQTQHSYFKRLGSGVKARRKDNWKHEWARATWILGGTKEANNLSYCLSHTTRLKLLTLGTRRVMQGWVL